jgi:peptidoglycan-associated lipoprotein
MLLSRRVSSRLCVVVSSAVLLAVAGCNKKPSLPPPVAVTPPPPAAKPTASITADKSTINPGESARLSWTTTNAENVSIAPEVGAVTAQGNTAVTPSASTTYTLTASGPGGSTDATVRVSVNAPAPVEVAPVSSIDELFLKEVRDAYFDYDSAEIRADAQVALRKTADFLKNYPQVRVTIEGHCDERGSTEYNLALGDRRANAVKQYLISLGLSGDRLNTVSFGKEKPFCMQSSEECYAQNRRGHFVQAK